MNSQLLYDYGLSTEIMQKKEDEEERSSLSPLFSLEAMWQRVEEA